MIRPLSAFTLLTLGVAACEPVPEAALGTCPTPTHGPTIHRSSIEQDEVWRADEGPHIVAGAVRVRAGATLDIEPCAVVQLEAGQSLDVAFPGTPTTGTLRALGTAEAPIRFEARDAAPWGMLRADTGATVRLAHVTLSGGGAAGSTILVSGDSTRPTRRNLFVDHVSVIDSAGVGIRLERDAGFAEGSQDLTIRGSASYPIVVDEHGLGTLPRGHYTGNETDRVLVVASGPITESATVAALDVPYQIGEFHNESLVIGAGPGSPLTTLTIEPGTRLMFFPGTGLEIEHITGEEAASGALIAEGTAAAPILFTSAADAPAPGDWQGLFFGSVPDAANSIRHARFEYTGADCGCVLLTCSAIEAHEGAVILTGPPARAFITDSVIAQGSSHGVVLGYRGPLVDFRAGLTFEAMSGCEQTRPSPGSDLSCPVPLPACM